ncbi:MAG: DUF5615 family PIN-like protein [Phycisphaerales bacterium]|nr:DUF5615 family PIN-like protein [Phycisphaerales bacterium]
MSVAFKVDEDLPVDVADVFRSGGFDADTVAAESLLGFPDEKIWACAQQAHRCLVTADKGFADARSHPPGSHCGIVLLRLPRESRASYVRLARSLVGSLDAKRLAGAMTVVAPEGVRVREG